MNTHRFLKIFLIITAMGLISGNAKADGPPPGFAGLTEEQKKCLDAKKGEGRPSPEQMKSVFKDCGINPPGNKASANAPKEKEKVASVEKVDPRDFIQHLKSLKGEHSDYVRLEGRIPKVCQDKISVSLSCLEDNKITFKVRELTENGFQCLKEHEAKCNDENSASECVSLEDLSKDKKLNSKFITKLDSQVDEPACKKINISLVKVAIVKADFDPEFAKTEGQICTDCKNGLQNAQVAKLEAEVNELKVALNRQQEMFAKGPPGGKKPGRFLPDDMDEDRPKPRFAGKKRPPMDDMDEDMPKPPGGGRGPRGMGANMNTTDIWGLGNSAGGPMSSMGAMGGMSMMGGGMGGMGMMGGSMRMMGGGGFGGLLGGFSTSSYSPLMTTANYSSLYRSPNYLTSSYYRPASYGSTTASYYGGINYRLSNTNYYYASSILNSRYRF